MCMHWLKGGDCFYDNSQKEKRRVERLAYKQIQDQSYRARSDQGDPC